MKEIAESAVIMPGAIIGDDVVIEDGVFIDYHCIIRDHVTIKKGSRIGADCILGEYLADFYEDLTNKPHPLIIGEGSLIRSGTIIYGDNTLGDHLQTGHRVTIREQSQIGHHVRIGTLSDIQGFCTIGNYVNIHSNVHIGQGTIIEDFVWMFPYVITTNDPTPPSQQLSGVTIKRFAAVAAGSVLAPGVTIGEDALVGAGSTVTKDVPPETVVVGNPARSRGSVRNVRNHVTGEPVYPWRYTFERGMPWAGIGYEEFLRRLDTTNK